MYLLMMILHRAQDNNNILLHLGLKLLTSIPQKTQKYLVGDGDKEGYIHSDDNKKCVLNVCCAT